MATVTLTLEEYQALVDSNNVPPRTMVSKPKKKGTPNPKLSRALKAASKKARKKDGSFRKGYDQARVMSMAHASLKRRSKK